jgi:hypothetical protein
LVHRVEIMRFTGEWSRAMEEAERRERGSPSRQFGGGAIGAKRVAAIQIPVGALLYEQGELWRVRGDLAKATTRTGRQINWQIPEPGMALLHLAHGRTTGCRGGDPTRSCRATTPTSAPRRVGGMRRNHDRSR